MWICIDIIVARIEEPVGMSEIQMTFTLVSRLIWIFTGIVLWCDWGWGAACRGAFRDPDVSCGWGVWLWGNFLRFIGWGVFPLSLIKSSSDEKLTAYWVFSGNILCCIQSWGGWIWIVPGIMVRCDHDGVHLMELCQRKDVNVYWQHFMLYQNWGGCVGTIPGIILWCTSLRSRGGKFQLVKGCQQVDVNVYWEHFMLYPGLRRMDEDCWCVKVWASSLIE